MAAVRWCVVVVIVVVGRFYAMLLPQPLFFLIACCRTITKVVAVPASPTLSWFEFLTLKCGVGFVFVFVDGMFFCRMMFLKVAAQVMGSGGLFVVDVCVAGKFQSVEFSLDVGYVGVQLIKCFHVELIFGIHCLDLSV